MMSPRMVLVVALLWIGCSDRDPVGTERGDLRVTMATVGVDLDPDGYVLIVDGDVGRPVGVNGSVTIRGLDDGTHELELTDVAANCELEVPNPRTVTVLGGATATTGFTVSCHPVLSSLRVITETGGDDLDPDGYQVVIDGGAAHLIGLNDTLHVADLPLGTHTVTLTGIAYNCETSDANPRLVDVISDVTTTTHFRVACTPPAELPMVPGQIAFSSNRSGNFDIYLLRSGVITQLTHDPAWDGIPAISPDGTRILFESMREDAEGDIYVMNVDGSGVTNLTRRGGADERPSWSPDGTKIVFASDRTGNFDIFVMNADGTDPINLTNDPSLDRPAAWSPDGTRIAFSSNRTGDFEIFVMDTDGSNLVNLTRDPDRVDFAPAWSPDGQRIAFTSRMTGEPFTDIRIMNADGTGQVNLTATPAVDERGPSWSPDGTQIVFGLRSPGPTQVYVMNIDGTGLRNVSRSPGSYDVPGWPQAWRLIP